MTVRINWKLDRGLRLKQRQFHDTQITNQHISTAPLRTLTTFFYRYKSLSLSHNFPKYFLFKRRVCQASRWTSYCIHSTINQGQTWISLDHHRPVCIWISIVYDALQSVHQYSCCVSKAIQASEKSMLEKCRVWSTGDRCVRLDGAKSNSTNLSRIQKRKSLAGRILFIMVLVARTNESTADQVVSLGLDSIYIIAEAAIMFLVELFYFSFLERWHQLFCNNMKQWVAKMFRRIWFYFRLVCALIYHTKEASKNNKNGESVVLETIATGFTVGYSLFISESIQCTDYHSSVLWTSWIFYFIRLKRLDPGQRHTSNFWRIQKGQSPYDLLH